MNLIQTSSKVLSTYRINHPLTICLLGNFSCFLSSDLLIFFFKINFFEKFFQELPLECQTVWILIRPDILSGLIWVQSVSKSYQQMTQCLQEQPVRLWAYFLAWTFDHTPTVCPWICLVCGLNPSQLVLFICALRYIFCQLRFLHSAYHLHTFFTPH